MAERSGDRFTDALTDLLQMQAEVMFTALFTEPLRQAAQRQARYRTEARSAAPLSHRELIEYCRALSDAHPDWPSSRIAESVARVFAAGVAQPEETQHD